MKLEAKTIDLSQLVETYTSDLYAWALYKVSDVELAKDLVQDTFLAAAEKWAAFQGNSTPKTWLFSILNYKIIDVYRSMLNQPTGLTKMDIGMKTLVLLITMTLFTFWGHAQTTRRANEVMGLETGMKAPLFEAVDVDNKLFELSEALESGPVVIIFYRGSWCPVCNRHLATIQDSLKLITDRGVSVVAISPEKPELLEKMADKTGAKFSLLYDKGYEIANAYDVTFMPKKAELLIYNTMLGAKLKASPLEDTRQLPIPATYIIDKDGTIVWRQFDPDYKKRSSIREIIDNLP